MDNPFKYIDVFILCGGFGKRLRKLNLNVPKPMAKMGDKPFLDIIIAYMANFGFRRFILGLGYKADFITKYYSNKPEESLKIIFSHEKNPLGTGGAVKKAKKLIGSNHFFVLNGDSFCQFNPRDLLILHRRKKALATILLKRPADDAKDCGEVKINGLSRIISFQEKGGNANKCLINSGVYVFDKKIFNLMPCQDSFSLEHDLFPNLLGNGLFGYIGPGYFIDIGTPKRFFKAKRHFSKVNINRTLNKHTQKGLEDEDSFRHN